MTRTLTAIAMLLAVAACSRQPAPANNGTRAQESNGAAAPAPVPAAPVVDATADEAAVPENEEGSIDADEAPGPEPVAEDERAQGCAGEIGLAAARRLVEQCRDVSPATRPPCNTANSCVLICGEIERSCRLFADDPPESCKDGG